MHNKILLFEFICCFNIKKKLMKVHKNSFVFRKNIHSIKYLNKFWIGKTNTRRNPIIKPSNLRASRCTLSSAVR